MQWRKLTAGQLFDGFTFHSGRTLVLNRQGRVEDLIPTTEAGDDIEQVNGIICPGLINAHCHLELSHMRGKIPEATGLTEFIWAIVTGRHFPDEEIIAAAIAADQAMWESGIQSVGDISNNALTVPAKKQSRIQYYNFIEASGWTPSVASLRSERAIDLLHYFEKELPRFKASVVPHAPYSVSEALWKAIQPWFAGRVVSMHNQETPGENAFFQQGGGPFHLLYQKMQIDNSHHRPSGQTSLQSTISHLKEASQSLLVHNTFTTKEDIDYAGSVAVNTFFCLCPNANWYIERNAPPVELLQRENVRIVLGTDSLASNWSLDILSEIKRIMNVFPAIKLEECLQWATSNGAAALQMVDLGSFEKGKQPGVIMIDDQLRSSRII